MLFNYTNVKREFANITIFQLLKTHNRNVNITSNATFKDMTKLWVPDSMTIQTDCSLCLRCPSQVYPLQRFSLMM